MAHASGFYAPTMQRMEYDYQAQQLTQPTPAQVAQARAATGQTQTQAAQTVYRNTYTQWRAWERTGPGARVIDLAVFELYLIKKGLRVCPNENKC
jgi:hypothetical protein